MCPIISVLATLNERFRHCLSMTKMLNSENVLAQSGLSDAAATNLTADRILYQHAVSQCQEAALDELLGSPGGCFQVNNCNFTLRKRFRY
jgi:serine/threonine-protein kinase ULK/ATG1